MSLRREGNRFLHLEWSTTFRKAKKSNIIFSKTTLQHSRTPITNRIESNTPHNSISISSKHFESTQVREIEVLPKKRPRKLRNSSRISYPFCFLFKTIRAIIIILWEEKPKLVEQEIKEKFRKGAISLIISPLLLVGKSDWGNHLVINLKELKTFIPHVHFKMESLFLLKKC